MACMAISSWSRQSQRSDPSTSPVKHCEWIRSNGTPSFGSPMTIASADSTRRVPFDTSRSYPMASNIPHLVGMRVDATRQSSPVCAALIVFALIPSFLGVLTKDLSRILRCAFLRLRRGAARAQALDVTGAEAQLSENLLIVLSERRRAPCRHFGDAMHLNRAADRRRQLAAGAFERNDDVIGAQLRIVDHLLRPLHDAERDVNAIEDLVPMRHRL